MAISHEEIIEFIIEELECMNEMLKCMPKRCQHLDEPDDDYVDAELLLDRWGDRQVPKDNHLSIRQRLEMEADQILAEAQ